MGPLSPIPDKDCDRMPPTRPRIIGIAGPSGSGKSCLATALARRYGDTAVLFPMDAFYRDLGHLPKAERAVQNFDHPDALEWDLMLAVLHALCAGLPAEAPVYDFTAHTRSAGAVMLAAKPLILLEGLHVLHEVRLRTRLHAGIYLECPREVCLARRIERDTAERGRQEAEVRAQFEAQVWPMTEEFVLPSRAHADLVLDGTLDLAMIEAQAAAWLSGTGALPPEFGS